MNANVYNAVGSSMQDDFVDTIEEEADNIEMDANVLDVGGSQSQDDFVETNEEATGINEETLQGNNVTINPDGSIECRPTVETEIKPSVGRKFISYEAAVEFYNVYAKHVGFEVRFSTTKGKEKDGTLTHRYLLCHRHGKPRKQSFNSLHDNDMAINERSTNFKVTDCKASMRIKRKPNETEWMIYHFEECHNHLLLEGVDKKFTREGRKLNLLDKHFIHRVSTANIGPVKAHKLQASLQGGCDNVGPTSVDYKNFNRDLRCYVGDADCEMVIEKFNSRTTSEADFVFEYIVDKGELTGILWADGLARVNYKQFGDVISFDATYRTNMYAMIFVPFTAVDNHMNLVVVGDALLASETYELYKWLLESFLKIHKQQPRLVLTDEDCSMKDAIEHVFPESRHRLCMWHIMNKVPGKVCGDGDDNIAFKKRLSKIIWNVHLDPEQFEAKWLDLVDEFKLSGNTWLAKKFDIRESWIPACFKDVPLCGLMKTTSRSESTNSFFGGFSNFKNNLVQFMFCYDTAMDKQRYKQRTEEYHSSTTTPTFRSHTPIEKHAARVYTRTIFRTVQKQILKAVWYCAQWSVGLEDGCNVYTIRQKDKSNKFKVEHKVVQNETEYSFECSCQHFQFYGILCQHVFTVLMNLSYEEIPERYVHKRWRKDIIPRTLLHNLHTTAGMDEDVANLSRDILDDVMHCIQVLKGDKQQLASFQQEIHGVRAKVDSNMPTPHQSFKKSEVIAGLIGVSRPDNVAIVLLKAFRTKDVILGKD